MVTYVRSKLGHGGVWVLVTDRFARQLPQHSCIREKSLLYTVTRYLLPVTSMQR